MSLVSHVQFSLEVIRFLLRFLETLSLEAIVYFLLFLVHPPSLISVPAALRSLLAFLKIAFSAQVVSWLQSRLQTRRKASAWTWACDSDCCDEMICHLLILLQFLGLFAEG